MAAIEPGSPPLLLDVARVLRYVVFPRAERAQDRVSAVVGGVAVDSDTLAALVIAENLAGEDTFLIACNRDWDTMAASSHLDVAQAEAAARSGCGRPLAWTEFRELTEEERREVETTRAFLRELLADDGI